MQNAQQRLEKLVGAALIQIIEERPFYFMMLKRIPKVFRGDLNQHCALGIDQNTGLLCILLNPRTLSSANVEEIKIILEHLLIHTLLPHQHQKRMEEGHSFHLACDLIINQSISDIKANPKTYAKGHPVFGNLLTPTCLKGLHDFNSQCIEHSSVYELWPIIQDKKHLEDLDFFTTIDETDFYLQNFVPINRWLVRDEKNGVLLKNQINRAVIKAVTELARMGKGPGDMPGFLLKAVNEILQESKVDYSTLLRNFALETIKKSRQRSWTRLNRKYPNQIRGNAKKIIDTNNLLIVMDTSGSMWHDELLDKVIAEIKKIRTICPNLWIVGGDVQENFRIQTKDDFKFSHLTLSGGGGTDLQFGFNAASELKVSGTIVLTDGFIPEFNNYDIDTVFVIVPGGEAVEGFRNIFLT